MRLEGRKGQFPVGMSVLAVDDDPVCLKVLEALLLRCRYYVTTTSQAITALKLLRENKDMFDLVISDVHMPDMDGFRLLEHVGLEMDLPVIMLSVNGETKTVMKGITHGACDYLLKPVRIEELRNIWQHVVRRKFSNHEWNGLDVYEEINKPPSVDSDHGQASTKGSTDQSASLSKKRKEQHNDEEDEAEESDAQENGEPSAPKKARVVWSVELHQKFVAAVNKLGIDKAVPKRILELMNVEKLTRENVASHLQKYRLYLKRLSSVASQQASIVAAVGGRDTSFLHMSVFEGFQSYQAVTPSAALPYFNPHGSLGRTNATISGFQHLAPSMAIQSSTSISTISQCVAETNRFQLARLPEKQQGSLTQGLSTLLGQGHLQQKWIHGEANNLPTVFSASGVTNYMCGALQSVPNSTLLTQELLECTQAKGGTQRSTRMPSVSSEHFEGAVRVSSNLLEQTGIFSGSELACPYNGLMVAKDSRSGVSSFGSTILLPPENEEHSKYSNCRDLNSSRQKTGESKPDHVLDSKLIWGSFLDSRLLNDMRVHNSPSSQGLNNCSIYHNAGACATRQSNASTSVPAPRTKIDMHASKDNLKTKNVYDLCISKMQGGISSNSCNLDGLLNSIINTEKDDVSLIDNELGCDFYPLGACM